MDAASRITATEKIPVDGTFLFTVRDCEADEEKEAILVRHEDGITGWLNYCQHFTHIKLDKGSGAEVRDGEIICTNHGAYFEEDTGRCTHGPCEGAYLEEIDITTRNGDVFLSDDCFEFAAVGPKEQDPLDLSSTSNVEF